MATTTTGALLPWIEAAFRTLDTDMPNAGGHVEFFVNGTPGTHKATYSQADLDPVSIQSNPVHLDANGRAIIFLSPGLYDVSVFDTDMELLYTVEGIGSGTDTPDTPVAIPLDVSGARNVTSGYTVLDSDHLITVNEPVTNPAIINLPTVAGRVHTITIKNVGPTHVRVVPHGVETLDGLFASYEMKTQTDTAPLICYTITLAPDATLPVWWVINSFGF